MLRTIPPPPLDTPPFPPGRDTPFDWDARLSLEFIRDHSKTADIPSVVDEQLRLYRAAAIETCEEYTGLLLSGQRNVQESVEGPRTVKPYTTYYTHHLQYPVADGVVYLYGGASPNDNTVFRVPLGTRKIKVPIKKDAFDFSNCCDPCAKWAVNGGMLVSYRAGFKSVDEVPSMIMLGLMQFITWCIEHPGDELMTQRNRVETRAGLAGLQGSNNIAMISGALESWRVFDREAF